MRLLLAMLLVTSFGFRDCGGEEAEANRPVSRPVPPSRENAPEPLEELKPALREEVSTTLVDGAHWQIANRVIASRVLVGKSRTWIEHELGAGVACGPSAPCPFADLNDRDSFYEVGRLPSGHLGGLPTLYLDYNANDVCESVRFRHTQ